MTQIKRSAGQSAVASAAYRSGEKLHSEYYGEDSDYQALQQKITPLYADTKKLWAIHYSIYQVQHEQERQNAVTRQKKQEIEH